MGFCGYEINRCPLPICCQRTAKNTVQICKIPRIATNLVSIGKNAKSTYFRLIFAFVREKTPEEVLRELLPGSSFLVREMGLEPASKNRDSLRLNDFVTDVAIFIAGVQ